MTAPYDDPDIRPGPLASLGGNRAMPDALEERVIASLRARGALGGRAPSRWRRPAAIGSLLAACLTFFLAGRFTAGARSGAPVTTARWMLLLYEDAGFEGPQPGREADYVEEYRAWASVLEQRGQVVGGAELPAGGTLVEPDGTARAVDLETAEAGRLSGYFMVAVPTLAEAQAIAASCPHLKHRGRIVIQPVGAS